MMNEAQPAGFLSSKLNFPVNMSSAEEDLFRPLLQWWIQIPQIQFHRCLFVFQNGMSASVGFKAVSSLDPSDEYHGKMNRFFFMGKLLKALRSANFEFVREPVVYCLNDYSNNYFHWFTEVLPKMIFAQEKKQNNIFFIPFELKDYQLKSLIVFNIKYRLAKRKTTCLYKATTIGKFSAMGCYHPDYLAAIRSKFLLTAERSTKSKQIYITRRNAQRRHIINEEQVHKVMLKYGIEIFDFDRLDFNSQVQICRDSTVLISLHGAALTNMIFMRPGSAVVEFVPKREKNDKCYFTLAGTMNLKYHFMACDMDGSSYVFSNYFIDINMLESIIKNILVESAKQKK